MRVLQVKQYHNQVANQKWDKADKTKAVRSMFYFMLEDNKGYPTELRQKGYIAFDNNSACFGMNEEKAIENYNKYKLTA